MLRRCIIVCLCIVGLVTSLAATATTRYSRQEWEKVFKEFGLDEVDSVPAGITPLRVESPSELRSLLAGASPRRRVTNITACDLMSQDVLVMSEALSITYSTVYLHETNSSQCRLSSISLLKSRSLDRAHFGRSRTAGMKGHTSQAGNSSMRREESGPIMIWLRTNRACRFVEAGSSNTTYGHR
jgi:hypothetical protein